MTHRGFVRWSFIVLLLTAWGGAMPMQSAVAGLLVSTGYETGDFSDMTRDFVKHACCSHNFRIVSTPTRAGSYAQRTELRKTDFYNQSGWHHGDPRSEWKTRAASPVGAVRWYGLSIYLPSDYAYDAEYEPLAQWHGTPSHQPLQIYTKAGNWGVSHDIFKGVFRGAYAKDLGKWTDWVVHAKWTAGHDGFLEIWKDGVKVVNRHNGPTVHASVPRVYHSFGVYKPNFEDSSKLKTPRIVYHDEIRIGDANSSYAEVAPGGGHLPPPGDNLPPPPADNQPPPPPPDTRLPPPSRFRVVEK